MDQAASAYQEVLRHIRECSKSQIWIAVSVYVLVAIVKKRLNLDALLYTLLQIFSLTLFEKMPIQQAFAGNAPLQKQDESNNQLNLFAF